MRVGFAFRSAGATKSNGKARCRAEARRYETKLA